VLLASLLPITAKAAPVAAVIATADSSELRLNHITEHLSLDQRWAGAMQQRDDHVAAECELLGSESGEVYNRAAGGALQAQI